MRVKRGVPGHAKHNKIRRATKGMSHPNRVSIKRGKQAVTKSLQYAYRDRRNRKRTFRALWNARINAAARKVVFPYGDCFRRTSPTLQIALSYRRGYFLLQSPSSTEQAAASSS
jgi:ribosomal protein L20